jgi:hypothetical protein
MKFVHEIPLVLVTTGYRSGGNVLLPVLRELRANPSLVVRAIAYDVGRDPWKSANEPFIDAYQYGSPSPETAGNMLDALAREHGAPVSLVLTGADVNLWEKNIIGEASSREIPTIAVLDAWMNYRSRFSDEATGKSWSYLPEKIAVMDGYACQGFLNEGMPAAEHYRLTITGNPYHDSIARTRTLFKPQHRLDVLQTLRLSHDAPVVHYGSGWLEPELAEGTERYLGFTDRSQLEDLVGALATMQPLPQLIIRMHPKEQAASPDRFASQIERARTAGITTTLYDPAVHQGLGVEGTVRPYTAHEIVLAADITCSSVSPLLGEVAMLGKHAISLQQGYRAGKPDYAAPFSDLGVVTRLRCAPEHHSGKDCRAYPSPDVDRVHREMIRGTIVDALANPVPQKPFAVSGRATENVVELVYSLLRHA